MWHDDDDDDDDDDDADDDEDDDDNIFSLISSDIPQHVTRWSDVNF